MNKTGTMEKVRYEAKAMFQGKAFYVEIRQGKKWKDWLKVGAVPIGLLYLLKPGKMRAESAECDSIENARLLAKGMNELA